MAAPVSALYSAFLGDSRESHTVRALHRQSLIWGGSIAAMLLLIFAWMSFTTFAGAVIVSGNVTIDSSVKKVQHQTGGSIAEIRVRDGARVRGGDILVKLDDTQLLANLAIIDNNIFELRAREARNIAERDDATQITFPGTLLFTREPSQLAILSSEERNFQARSNARKGMKLQLNERIGQLRNEIDGITEQVTAKTSEIGFIKAELTGVRELRERNLVPLSRLTALEREAARLDGERGQLIASISQAKGKIAEISLQIIQVDQDLRTEVAKELSDIRPKLTEFLQKKAAVEDQLSHLVIRAPDEGVVHQSIVHTVGGVVSPAETIMVIVPDNDRFVAEVKVSPRDIDRVAVGQPVGVHFSTINRSKTPNIEGTVRLVSADTTQDQRSGNTYYTCRIEFNADQRDRLKEIGIVSGMPVEAFIRTADRTVLSYLTKPLVDQVVKAWRE